MKKYLIFAGIGIFAILSIIFIIIQTNKQSEQIKIGVILPLTGGNAQWGIPPKKGAELAVKEINAQGGVLGKRLSLVIEDGQCDPKTGISAFKKLFSIKDIKIVMGEACSSSTLAIAPIAEKNNILLISPASTSPLLTDAGDYIFRVIPSDALRGKIFAKYLFLKRNIRNVDILYINNDGGLGNRISFKNNYEALGGVVILDESYDQNSSDMRTQLSKIKASNAGALLLISYLSDTAQILKQIKELGIIKPLFLQTEAIEDPTVLKVAGNTAEGVIYILSAKADNAKQESFAKSYEREYDIKPELYAAEGYDIIYLIADAIKETNQVKPSLIKEYIYSVSGYQGASGIITFDKNGDVIKPMVIKIIKNNEPIDLEILK
jgi:branched-chain amino acid transport system substrate-binding protein